MKANLLVFVEKAERTAFGGDPWSKALGVQLGGVPALRHYCEALADHAASAEVLMPEMLIREMLDMREMSESDHLTVRTYRRCVGDAPRISTKMVGSGELIVVDASRLPRVDTASVVAAHRRSGTAMTVFYQPLERDYCREELTTDATGAVRRAARLYLDSGEWQLKRRPLALVLSRHLSPGRRCRASTFGELVAYFAARVHRAGDRVTWTRSRAVRGHFSPLAALLELIERVHAERSGELPASLDRGADGQLHTRGAVLNGENVRIAPSATIVGPTALGDGVTVGARAVVSRSIVLPGETIADDAYCHHQVVGVGGADLAEADPSVCFVAPDEDEELPAGACAGERVKRLFDVIGAAVGLVLLLPVFAIVALAIQITNPGPVFFSHRRQGRGGIEFQCLKFRTMVLNADKLQAELRAKNQVDGPQFKLADDPRVTRIGKLLRRTNIDELPQLFNVLFGQMSLVGPRPSPDGENQCCPAWRKARLSVRPGITGLWQVARSEDRQFVDFQEWIYFDTLYVERRSLALDLQIIWQTIRVLLHLGVSPRWREQWLPSAEHYRDIEPIRRIGPGARVDGDRPRRFTA